MTCHINNPLPTSTKLIKKAARGARGCPQRRRPGLPMAPAAPATQRRRPGCPRCPKPPLASGVVDVVLELPAAPGAAHNDGALGHPWRPPPPQRRRPGTDGARAPRLGHRAAGVRCGRCGPGAARGAGGCPQRRRPRLPRAPAAPTTAASGAAGARAFSRRSRQRPG